MTAQFDRETFRTALVQGIKKVSKIEVGDDFAFDQPLSLIGLDSLDTMNLVLEVETILGTSFGEFNLSENDSADEFYARASSVG